jgi:hypothetical protein
VIRCLLTRSMTFVLRRRVRLIGMRRSEDERKNSLRKVPPGIRGYLVGRWFDGKVT